MLQNSDSDRVKKLKLNMQEASHPVPKLLPVQRNVLVHPAERCRSPWEVQRSPSKFLPATAGARVSPQGLQAASSDLDFMACFVPWLECKAGCTH